jgi:hypothetical protein
VENDAGRCLRCLRASVDTGDREPAELSVEGVPFDAVEQRRGRRQDEGSADQGRAQSQDSSDEDAVTLLWSKRQFFGSRVDYVRSHKKQKSMSGGICN